MNKDMFKVYKKDFVVKINGEEQTLSLLPLGGKYLPKLMGLASSKSTDKDNNAVFKEEDFVIFHELITETIKFSYDISEEKELNDLDLFVSQNMVMLVPILFKLNNLDNAVEE